ncbi:crossover junction endodeoxyribonuclease RuvC [Gammaproteobacteria bacterium]
MQSFRLPRILGIDPGSRITGFGVIDVSRGKYTYVTSGTVQSIEKDFCARLKTIFEGVRQVVQEQHPTELAIEQVFLHKNVDSALKLGQARGAALCAAFTKGMPVTEYMPSQIKQAVVGYGSATKEQVQHMVRLLLQLPATPSQDAADALAVAICHCHYANDRLRT